jgi:hypothetical protein
MSQQVGTTIAVMGVDIGKNSFHVVGLDQRGAIVDIRRLFELHRLVISADVQPQFASRRRWIHRRFAPHQECCGPLSRGHHG